MTPLELQRCHSERWRQPPRKWNFGFWPISSTIYVRFARYRRRQPTTLSTVSAVEPRLEATLGDITAGVHRRHRERGQLGPRAAAAGVCGAIFAAAGPGLADACAAVGGCPTGDARATPGFALPARWIIHAVGPVWHGGDRQRARAPGVGVPPGRSRSPTRSGPDRWPSPRSPPGSSATRSRRRRRSRCHGAVDADERRTRALRLLRRRDPRGLRSRARATR